MGEGLDFSPSEDSEGESEATDMDDFCILDAPGTGIPVSLVLSLFPPFLKLFHIQTWGGGISKSSILAY